MLLRICVSRIVLGLGRLGSSLVDPVRTEDGNGDWVLIAFYCKSLWNRQNNFERPKGTFSVGGIRKRLRASPWSTMVSGLRVV
jgi:hypothetical protein